LVSGARKDHWGAKGGGQHIPWNPSKTGHASPWGVNLTVNESVNKNYGKKAGGTNIGEKRSVQGGGDAFARREKTNEETAIVPRKRSRSCLQRAICIAKRMGPTQNLEGEFWGLWEPYSLLPSDVGRGRETGGHTVNQ